MLNSAKTALSVSIVPADYSVFISPSSLVNLSGNGAATTPKATANVTGGVGPLTYLWEIDNPSITINSPTDSSTSFSASGYNDELDATITLTVTDTGNGNLETSDTSTVIFIFGIQP